MTRAKIAFPYLFATVCVAASPVQAQSLVRERQTTIAQDKEKPPRLTIRVYRIDRLPGGTLVWAEAEAARILRGAHLKLTWVNCPDPKNSALCAIPEQPSELCLRLLPTALPRATANALGMAVASPYGNCAFLFYDRILACHMYRGLIHQVLGRVIAHEIVHLLLPSSGHSTSGLMRPKWSTEDLQFASDSWLWLSARSIVLLREEALRRMRATKTVLE
jgi:hypothetical protein